MKASSGWLSRKRRREAAYQRGYEAGLAVAMASGDPVAYLRHGEQTFVQNVPFAAMWISDKDDPRSFPVYDRPQRSAPSVAVQALDAVSPDLLLYNLITEAVNEGVAKVTDPDWTSKDFINSPSYQAIHTALSAQVQDVAESGLTLSALQSAHVERQEEWCPDMKPDLSFRGNELGGECDEAQNVIKKLERERHGWRGSRDTIEHLAEELADVIHCAMLVAITAGIDLERSVVAKFNDTSTKNGLSTVFPTAPAKQEGDSYGR